MDANKLKKAIDSIKTKDRPKGVFSTKELSISLGITQKNCAPIIKDLVESGRVEFAGKFPVKTISQSTAMVPMYRMIK